MEMMLKQDFRLKLITVRKIRNFLYEIILIFIYYFCIFFVFNKIYYLKINLFFLSKYKIFIYNLYEFSICLFYIDKTMRKHFSNRKTYYYDINFI